MPGSRVLSEALRAVLKITDADDVVLGTGFFVDDAGGVLTCHHVADFDGALFIHTASGQRVPAALDLDCSDPDHDLALLRAPLESTRPLPIIGTADLDAGTAFWMSGFQLQSSAIAGAFTERGVLGTTQHVSYAARRHYALNVRALDSHAWHPGMSGAPVLDEDTGVVLGLVTSKFEQPASIGGYAVLLNGDLELAAGLSSVVERNRLSVPRFGRLLNSAGARIVCRAQQDSAVEASRQQEDYAPEQFVPRPTVEGRLRQFLSTSKLDGHAFGTVFGLVGPSGTGKSTVLLNLASTPLPTATVLLRARDSRVADVGVRDLLSAALEAASARLQVPLSPTAPDDLASVLRTEANGLVILLDGLNELPGAIDAAAWIRQTIAWLRSVGAKLIVSSREEFWSRYYTLLYPGAATSTALEPWRAVQIADYDDQEARLAYERYGLQLDEDEAIYLHHPQLLRLYAALAAELGDGAFHPSRVDLLAAYANAKSSEVAMRRSITTQFARSVLERFVRASLQAADLWLDESTFYSICAADSGVCDAWIDSHVLAPAGDGIRFAFDELGEYLQALSIVRHSGNQFPAVETLLADYDADRLRTGTATFVPLVAQQFQGDKALAGWLDQLFTVELNAQNFWPVVLARRVLQRLPSVAGFLPQVHRLLELDVSVDNLVSEFELERLSRLPGLPLRDRLQVCRAAAPALMDHPWRFSDWEDTQEPLKDMDRIAERIHDLVASDPPQTLPMLVDWLTDERPLVGFGSQNEATVAHVACAFLMWYAPRSPSIYDAVARQNVMPVSRLVKAMARHDPENVADAALGWARQKDLHLQQVALSAAAGALALDTTPALGVWEDVLRELARTGLETTIADSAMALLLRQNPEDLALIDELLARLQADDPGVDGHMFGPALKLHFARVISAFRTYLQTTTNTYGRLHAVSAIAGYEETPQQSDELLSFLDYCCDVLRSHPDDPMETGLADAIAARVRRSNVPGAVISPGLRRLVERVLTDGSAHLRQPLYWAIVVAARTQQFAALQAECVARADAGAILAALGRRLGFGATPEPIISMVQSKLEPEAFEFVLLEAAIHESNLLSSLRELIDRGVINPPRFALAEVFEHPLDESDLVAVHERAIEVYLAHR